MELLQRPPHLHVVTHPCECAGTIYPNHYGAEDPAFLLAILGEDQVGITPSSPSRVCVRNGLGSRSICATPQGGIRQTEQEGQGSMELGAHPFCQHGWVCHQVPSQPVSKMNASNPTEERDDLPINVRGILDSYRERYLFSDVTLVDYMAELSRSIGQVDWQRDHTNGANVVKASRIVRKGHFPEEWVWEKFCRRVDNWFMNLYALQGDTWILNANQLLLARWVLSKNSQTYPKTTLATATRETRSSRS